MKLFDVGKKHREASPPIEMQLYFTGIIADIEVDWREHLRPRMHAYLVELI